MSTLYGEPDVSYEIGLRIGDAMRVIHRRNVAAGWYTDLNTGESLVGKRNVPEMLMLTVSELGEAGEDSPQYYPALMSVTKTLCRAMEGYRKTKMDDKLPDRPAVEVELADAVIRILDLAANLKLDLGGAIAAKLEFNRNRPDHKLEARRVVGGKQF